MSDHYGVGNAAKLSSLPIMIFVIFASLSSSSSICVSVIVLASIVAMADAYYGMLSSRSLV
eukprot:285331-Ditylum_brightwellii.AAC.1